MMCRWQFQVEIGDSEPQLFHSGSEVIREAEVDAFSPTCGVPNLFGSNFGPPKTF